MAKTIITQDGSALNYANVLTIFVEENPDDETDKTTYLLSADVVAKVTYVLGEYDTEEEAESAKTKLIEWLQCETYGVYSMNGSEGDV